MSLVQASATLTESIPTLLTWLDRCKAQSPKHNTRVSVGWRDGKDIEESFCVSTIADIEESIWAPKYGLKGKIDASVEATFVADSASQVSLLLCAHAPGKSPYS